MNTMQMSQTIGQMARKIRDREDPKTGVCSPEDADISELLQVLCRIIDRSPMVGPEALIIRRAFGAPGDWGYGTPIGEALRQPG